MSNWLSFIHQKLSGVHGRLAVFALLSLGLLLGCSPPVDAMNSSASDIATAKSTLTVVFTTGDSSVSVTKDVIIQYKVGASVAVTWASTNISVISNVGVVTRPPAGSADASVTLTATLTKGTASDTKAFALTVKALPSVSAKIKIGSFNAQILGPTKVGRPNTLAVLAGVATQFDLLAIQEVGSNNSSALESTCVTVMDTFVAKMNSIVGAGTYGYYRGSQYAYVYKKTAVDVLDTQLYVGAMTFTYQPLVGNFKAKAGNFDFSMVTIHTSPGVAVTEIPALATVVTEVKTLYNEPDVIVLGDFNADGTYFSEGAGADLAGWSSTSYITGIPNSADTTVATSSNTYDRIQMTKDLATDFSGTWGVTHFSDLYDVSACEGTASTAGTESALSDHYPVWAEFSTNQDLD